MNPDQTTPMGGLSSEFILFAIRLQYRLPKSIADNKKCDLGGKG